MAGFISYAVGGVGFILLAAIETLSAAFDLPRFLPFAVAAALSVLYAADSLVSSIFSAMAASSIDPLGASLPSSSLPVAFFFLLYVLSSLASLYSVLPLPPSALHLISLSAFAQEFLLFRLRNSKDPDGLENRYFDLLFVPILICAASSLLAVARPTSPFPRIARAAGLALHGSWLIQMAFSLFTSLMAHGCVLIRRSRANFTVVCHAHGDLHRGSAIATLQFNCHLAGLVIVAVGIYAALADKVGGGAGGQLTAGYSPIDKELNRMEHVSASNFSIDSDEDMETNQLKHHGSVSVSVNGFGGAY
ncbi:hypothetical protein HPP92_025618 [Vanilla planifolia]|uniref:Uncharacterized protein n=1 Tax=Vanilla planifolia TaxID=51239 RepID=A0A835PJK2_VANPL|nr:hypothetical protein HPP92_025618 [Vanilla planifolia]